MEQTAGTGWDTLLKDGRTPRWVPSAVARVIAEAHAADRSAYALPRFVQVDETGQDVAVRRAADNGEKLDFTKDLAWTLCELFSLAIQYPSSARHVFQQTALLWRAYREARDLSVHSDFEQSMVQAVASLLYSRHPERWLKRLVRDVERGRIDTLHVWIDSIYENGIR